MVAGEAILSCPNAIKPLVFAPYPAGGAAAALGVSAPPRRGMLPPWSGCPLALPLTTKLLWPIAIDVCSFGRWLIQTAIKDDLTHFLPVAGTQNSCTVAGATP